MGPLSPILEAARSRLDRRAREEEARAATAGESPSFCARVQPVLQLFIKQGGDLQALLAPTRAMLAREEEARAATAGESPSFCARVQPVLQLFIKQGGDLQALLADERTLYLQCFEGWTMVIEANKGLGGRPRCPVCNSTTRSGAIQGIIHHMRSSHPTEFLRPHLAAALERAT